MLPLLIRTFHYGRRVNPLYFHFRTSCSVYHVWGFSAERDVVGRFPGVQWRPLFGDVLDLWVLLPMVHISPTHLGFSRLTLALFASCPESPSSSRRTARFARLVGLLYGITPASIFSMATSAHPHRVSPHSRGARTVIQSLCLQCSLFWGF